MSIRAKAAEDAGKRGITLWPLIAATYFMASGGPYGLEEAVSSAGYAGAILLILITPWFGACRRD
jgi:hypothetical protein